MAELGRRLGVARFHGQDGAALGVNLHSSILKIGQRSGQTCGVPWPGWSKAREGSWYSMAELDGTPWLSSSEAPRTNVQIDGEAPDKEEKGKVK